MSKRNDPEFTQCMDQFNTPADVVGVGIAAAGHSPLSAIAGVLAHHGVHEIGEAVCDGTLTSDALGPPASYFDAKVGYHPGAAPPSFELPSDSQGLLAGPWDFTSPSALGQDFQHLQLDVAPDWRADFHTEFHAAPSHGVDHFDSGSSHDTGYSAGSDSGGGNGDSGYSDSGSHSGSGDGGGI